MDKRQGFSSRSGFIAAAAGGAVGLGNIWKFPFEVSESGGAAFIVIYLIFSFLLCFPLLVTEIAIGRKTQRNQVASYNALGYAKWSLLGKFGILSGILILSFYNIVASWCFGYFVEILMGNFSIGEQFPSFITDIIKTGGYAVLFMIVTALVVSRGITRGIERFSKIFMPIFIFIILLLAGYSVTLPGAYRGIEFYLFPDFSKISFEVVYNAMGHAFFSLSLGLGAMVTYGSYVSKRENILSSAIAITLADIGVAFCSGLMLFPLVFSQGLETKGGPGLIFVTLPGVFESLGSPVGVIIGSLFFLLLSFAALTSTPSILEMPVSYLVENHRIKRKPATWLSAIAVFILGIPSLLANGYSGFFTNFITYFGDMEATDFMTFIGDLAANTFLPFGGLLTAIFTAFVWKKENLYKEIIQGNEGVAYKFLARLITFSIRRICPWILGTIFTLNILEKFFGIILI